MKVYPEAEVREAWNHVLETREKIGRGEMQWADIAQHFTEDAVYLDPVWGRYVGRAAIAKFMHDCMVGLDEWRFPPIFSVIKDNLVICAFYSRVPGRKKDGSFPDCFCVNLAIYAGNGLFSYENDIFNVVEIGELIQEAGWVPPPSANVAPPKLDRNPLPATIPENGYWGLQKKQ